MGFFQWVTEGVRRAVVRGIEQAADDINEAGGDVDVTFRLPAHREPLRLPSQEPVRTGSNGRRKATV